MNSLEKEYSGVCSRAYAICQVKGICNDEGIDGQHFQQEILEITMLAEQTISTQSEIEDSKMQLSSNAAPNPVSSNLRLPSLPLSEFTEILYSWFRGWDQ